MSGSGSTPVPSPRPTHRSAWQVFSVPLLVGIVATAGLIFGLFGDGIWDGLSWLALSAPVLLCLVYGLRRRPVSARS